MADTKLQNLTALTAPAASDVLFIVDDPAGTPLDRKITAEDLLSKTSYKTTWTPTIVGATAAGTGTYTTQSGTYAKIANIVFLRAYISWTAHTGTGNMRIGGLPFTPSTTASVFQPFAVWFSDLTLSAVGNKVQIYASPVQPQLNIEEVAGGTSAALAIDTAGSLMISGFYFVD